MADAEWWCVETSGGTQLNTPGELPPKSRFENREAAVGLAKMQAQQYEDPLTVVKYTRTLVRTFQRKVTVEETEAPAGA